MFKDLSVLTRTPKTQEELRFRTRQRFGAAAVVGLALFVAVKVYPLLIVIAAVAAVGVMVRKAGRQQNER